ncbi:ABC transporter [Arcanobacterium hippocoleae]
MALHRTSSWYRFTSNVKISWISSTAFATVGTAVVTLIALPVLNVVFDILLGADLAAPELARTGYSAALVAMIAAVCGGVVSAVAADRNLGIFEQVHLQRRFDFAYWLAKAVMPAVLSCITSFVLFALVTLSAITMGVNDGTQWILLGKTILLTPPALLIGIFLGIGAAGLGVNFSDPYMGGNIFAAFLPLAAGVIVPTQYYPNWLLPLTSVLPGSGLLSYFVSSSVLGIFRDLFFGVCWAVIGVLLARYALSRLRTGMRRESL